MRHLTRKHKLGRKTKHRESLLANLVSSLIIHHRIKTTLAKAKAARPLADKVVTLGKKGTLHDRRLAVSKLGQESVVAKLFKDIAPKFADRKGGYTRIIKIGPRVTDAAPMALLEWVDYALPAEEAPVETKAKAPKTIEAEAETVKEEKAEKKPSKAKKKAE
jgi:large subunit ribosomal protein L17